MSADNAAGGPAGSPAEVAPATALSRTAVPALKRHFRFQWEPAQATHVLLYPEGMIKLNGSAGEIMACVDGERTIDTIIDLLQRKFADDGGLSDESAAAMASDIIEFFGVAHDKRWIDFK